MGPRNRALALLLVYIALKANAVYLWVMLHSSDARCLVGLCKKSSHRIAVKVYMCIMMVMLKCMSVDHASEIC